MEIIDQTTWNRKEAFELFSKMDYPFYSVTIPMDVTNVKAKSREKQVSFYYLMVWLCTKALNSVAQFRLRIRDDQIVRIDQVNPSFTDMRKGEEQFHIISMPWEEDAIGFCQHAKRRSENYVHFIEGLAENDALAYFSCTPWFDFTALTNAHSFDKDDLIPRLAWGKYHAENDRLWLHMSIEVNHRMIDGFHIGLLKDAIDAQIASLDGMR